MKNHIRKDFTNFTHNNNSKDLSIKFLEWVWNNNWDRYVNQEKEEFWIKGGSSMSGLNQLTTNELFDEFIVDIKDRKRNHKEV